MRLNTLEFFEQHPNEITTGNILNSYLGVYNKNDLLEALNNEYNNILSVWSNTIDVNINILYNYIEYYYNKPSNFIILEKNKYNNNYYIKTKLILGDLFIILDWYI